MIYYLLFTVCTTTHHLNTAALDTAHSLSTAMNEINRLNVFAFSRQTAQV